MSPEYREVKMKFEALSDVETQIFGALRTVQNSLNELKDSRLSELLRETWTEAQNIQYSFSKNPTTDCLIQYRINSPEK